MCYFFSRRPKNEEKKKVHEPYFFVSDVAGRRFSNVSFGSFYASQEDCDSCLINACNPVCFADLCTCVAQGSNQASLDFLTNPGDTPVNTVSFVFVGLAGTVVVGGIAFFAVKHVLAANAAAAAAAANAAGGGAAMTDLAAVQPAQLGGNPLGNGPPADTLDVYVDA